MTEIQCNITSSVNITETYIMGSGYRQKILDRAYMSTGKIEHVIKE
jgi:hypothetical protein